MTGGPHVYVPDPHVDTSPGQDRSRIGRSLLPHTSVGPDGLLVRTRNALTLFRGIPLRTPGLTLLPADPHTDRRPTCGAGVIHCNDRLHFTRLTLFPTLCLGVLRTPFRSICQERSQGLTPGSASTKGHILVSTGLKAHWEGPGGGFESRVLHNMSTGTPGSRDIRWKSPGGRGWSPLSMWMTWNGALLLSGRQENNSGLHEYPQSHPLTRDGFFIFCFIGALV